MNRFCKATAAIAGGLIALGLVFGLIGTLLGGRFFQMGSYLPSYWMTMPGKVISGSGDWGIPGSNSFSQSYSRISSLEVESGMAQVTIKEGSEFAVKAEGIARHRFESIQEDGTLIVRCEPRENAGFHRKSSDAPKVTITVPKGFVAEELELEIGMGSLKASGLRSKNCIIDVGMGEAVLTDFTSEGGTLQCGMGSIEIQGDITGKQVLDCSMGSIQLDLAGSQADYDFSAEVGMGRVEVGGQGSGGLGTNLSRMTGAANFLSIECGMGDVSISFAE